VSRILVIAPHPDDETLGCGGTLLRHQAAGDEIHWLLVTAMHEADGFTPQRITERRAEIEAVHNFYGFTGRHELGLPAARLDELPLGGIVRALGDALRSVKPDTVYMPFSADTHSDHGVVVKAASSALKWFRTPGVNRVLVYETPSETGFNLDPASAAFRPNWYVNITEYLPRKIEAMRQYKSEMGSFPFPRSAETIEALARTRGSLCGHAAAEAFMLAINIQ